MADRPLALVTGASGGIGLEFARRLAPDHDLVLVARSLPRLTAARTTVLADGAPAVVDLVTADLSTPDGVDTVVEHVRAGGRPLGLMVNNAGAGRHGPFLDGPASAPVEQVALDVTAVVALTRALLPAMVAAGRGGVINVGSTAGFQPTPGLATYAAAKAFVLSFSEALAVEVRGTGVTITVVAPGTVDTGFFAAAGATFRVGGLLSADVVVRDALRGYRRGRTLVIPGRRNRLGALGPRVMPRGLMARMAGRAARAR